MATKTHNNQEDRVLSRPRKHSTHKRKEQPGPDRTTYNGGNGQDMHQIIHTLIASLLAEAPVRHDLPEDTGSEHHHVQRAGLPDLHQASDACCRAHLGPDDVLHKSENLKAQLVGWQDVVWSLPASASITSCLLNGRARRSITTTFRSAIFLQLEREFVWPG